MSVHAISWALESDLPCPERMVLVVLANFSNQDGESYPSQKTIARMGGLTRPAVNKILARLETKSWLLIIPRQHESGADKSYLYKLNIPEEAKGKTVVAPAAQGFVYVAETDILRKVGIARVVESRMRSLSAQCGCEVRVVKSFPMDMKSARLVEQATLDALERYRTKGEWISCSAKTAIEAVDKSLEAVDKSLRVVCLESTPPCNRGTHLGVPQEHTLNLHLTKKEEPTAKTPQRATGAATSPAEREEIAQGMRELAASLGKTRKVA